MVSPTEMVRTIAQGHSPQRVGGTEIVVERAGERGDSSEGKTHQTVRASMVSISLLPPLPQKVELE